MKKKLITISEISNLRKEEQNINFNYQKELTEKLDELNSDFSQEIINEIVLWKVDRYAKIPKIALELLNRIDKNPKELDEKLTREILTILLDKETKGFGLPMVSTILRFKNPNVYQIIDQRAYRIIFEKNPKYSTVIEKQIELYLSYLKELKNICKKNNLDFKKIDRTLYELDKKYNKEINIR